MRRSWRPSWVGLAVLASGGCGAAQVNAPAVAASPPAVASRAPAPRPAWLRRFPPACGLGASGPTLNPADALGEARRVARARLVTRGGAIEVKSIDVTTATGEAIVEQGVTLEAAEGQVARASIRAMWYDAAGVGPQAAPGCAYAVACGPATGTDASAGWPAANDLGRAGPRWIYDAPQAAGRMCAVGFSGPTLDPDDAQKNADEAARGQLAEAIAIKARTALAIFDNDEVLYGAETQICDTCLQTAAQGAIAERWRDVAGEGPLPHPGTAYALCCLDL